MSVRIGCGLSEHPEAPVGAIEAATRAGAGLGGESADLVVVFAAGAHLDVPEATLESVRETLGECALIGCGAGGVLGDGRELEGGTAISVWAAALGDAHAESFHAALHQEDDALRLHGLPDPEGASGMVMLPDPYSFPTEQVLTEIHRVAPAVPVIGGLSSGRTPENGCVLFYDDEVVTEGAVGVAFAGLELLPCVSQGAAPLGPELTVTAAEGNVISELAGRPALRALQTAIEALGDRERALISGGLLLGVVIDGGKPDYEHGDFLVRGLVGADPATGTVTVGAPVEPGQVVRLHARDASSADLDLRQALALRRAALGGGPPAGALMFTCNGRGRGMFGTPDHDAAALLEELAAPCGGFFAAGEIGPVGGQPFVHGFTATVGVFAR